MMVGEYSFGDGTPYVMDVNANPDITFEGSFAVSCDWQWSVPRAGERDEYSCADAGDYSATRC